MPSDFKTELTEVLSHYNLGKLVRGRRDLRGTVNTSYAVETLKNVQRRRLFVRRYRRGVGQEEILFEHSVLSHVARDPGCPVAPAYRTREGQTFLHIVRERGDPQGAYYAVFDFLPGEDRYTWVGPRCTRTELRNAGALLARFHRAARTVTPQGHRAEPKIYDLLRVIDTMWASSASRSKGTTFDRYLERNYGLVRKSIAGTMAALSQPAARSLPEVIIHCDYHPGNLKFEGEEITGLVDFDWSKLDLRAFDVALAVWYFCASWERAADGHLRLGEAKEFLRAYQRQLIGDPDLSPLSHEEMRYLPHLIDAANIYVLYWTLRDYFGKDVDPEEYLIYLRHGVRFARRLAVAVRRERLAAMLMSLQTSGTEGLARSR
jgi:homoserine kinase type II